MKRVLTLLVVGTVVSGLAAYAAAARLPMTGKPTTKIVAAH